MKNGLLQQATRFYQNWRRKQLWYRMVSGMACVVVFCTVYALILPAITMEKEPACGLEEHTHTEACYTVETVWPSTEYLCSEESLSGHVHGEDCCDEDGDLICGYADFVVHTHDESCYDRNGDLACPLEEIEEHRHDANCYSSTEVLTCGEEETGHVHDQSCYTRVRGDMTCGLKEEEGHTHGSGCYETERDLVCTLEEGEDHTHGESCYETRQVLTCELEESKGHTHGDDCYDWTEELTCGREEAEGHIHSADCYTTVRELVCDEEEVTLHTHDEDCFDEDGNLICGKLQVLEHQHDETCAVEPEGEPEEMQVLTCGLKEHTHTDACWDQSAAEEPAYLCGLEEHTHSEDCYDEAGELTCGLEEHVHDETCLAPQEPAEALPDNAFPEELPEGYAEYTFDSEDGLSVVAYAPENAFGGQPVTLKAEKLAEDSQGYMDAQANLDAAEDVEYDGFVALDIRFEDEAGTEVEPDAAQGPVYVKLDALALLPDGADQASVAVQHHCAEAADPIVAVSTEPETVVQTVADGSEDTGTVEVTPTAQTLEEDSEQEVAALDVTAEFSVESFSTFTITWGYTSNFVLNLHYIDTAGNDIAPSGIEINFETVDNTANVTMSNYADRIDHPGYAYQYACIDNGGVKTAVNKISYNTDAWYFTTKITTDPQEDDWTKWTDSDGKTSMDVYLVYQQIDMDNTVKVTWQNGEYALYLHYVDTNGNPLQIDASQTYVDSVAGVGNIRVSDYAGLVYPASYQYQNAYIEVNDVQTEVARISYNVTLGHWCITTPEGDGSNQWLSWSGSETDVYNETQAHVYLRFTMDSSAYYYAQPIHNNIKLTLYDYGSYINTGADKVIPFYQAMGKHSSIDGLPAYSLGSDSWPPAMEPTLNAAGYPQVSSGRSLEYLFRKDGLPLNTGSAADPLTEYADMRTNTWTEDQGYQTQFESMRFDLGSDGGLFHVDADGYYIYNCDEQSAYYNQDTNRFELSDTLIDVGHNGYFYKNFLPFDKIDPSLGGSFNPDNAIYKLPYSETEDKSSGIADLWFGMTMQVDFYMPSSGKVNGKDMVFEFQGDDDVWVYIDDVLVLDIGGCHGARRGSINFATGNVAYPNPKDDGATTINTTLKDLFTNAGVSTASFGNSNTFIDWTEHTLKFYYMERGGNISSCHLKFNLPTRPDKALQVAKTLTADKDADADVVKHLENTMEYKFRVVKADASGNPTSQLLINAGDPYTLSGAGLTANETRTVGAGGYFTLKAGQMAEFTNMLARFDENDSVKKYVVQEVLPKDLTGQYQDVVYSVGSDTGTCKDDATTVETDFTGYNSPAQSADTGNLVNYTNKVDTERLSTLEITKTQVGSSLNGPQTYYMKVLLGPDADSLSPVAAGTPYFVGDKTRYVETEGIIALSAGETARLKLLAGTWYSVVEVADASGTDLTGNEGYTPTYINESGSITELESKVSVNVTNTFPRGSLELSKTVSNTAGGSTTGTFNFELRFPVGDGWQSERYPASLNDREISLTFERNGTDAVATVSLQHGQTITVSDLPPVPMTITETNSDGYAVSWQVDGQEDLYGNSVCVRVTNGTTVSAACTNTTGYELPSTGGAGTTLYTAGGLALIFGAAILLYTQKKRRKEELTQS